MLLNHTVISLRVSTHITLSPLPHYGYCKVDWIYVLTRGSIVKMVFKKSMLSAWTSFLWFSKVRERMERRCRRERSIMHSSRNSSVLLFSFLLRSSQTLKKKRRRRNMRFILVLPWSKGLPSSPSLLWSLTHDLGVVLPCPRLWSTSWETWYLILSRTSVCFLQEVPQASYPTQCSFAYSWSLTDICTNIFL